MRVGIVGTGFMGTMHAESWAQTGAVIAGFLSEPPEDSQRIAAQYHTTAYPTLGAMLAEVDVVDICTPTHLHHPMVMKAAEAGKDIVCEKPLARTVEQAQEMVAVCHQAGVKLMVGHVVRFAPEYARAKALVEGGEIGQPAVIRLSRCTFRPKRATDNWYVDFEKSGGVLFDLMIHDLDYARWIAGDVECVFARGFSSSQPGQSPDYCLVILRHKSGTLSHVEGAWAYPPPYFRTRLEIAGSSGWLEMDTDKATPISVHLHGSLHGSLHDSLADAPDVPVRRRSLRESIYTTQIKAFYAALVGEAEAPISGQDGLAAVQIAAAALESMEKRAPVTLERLPGVYA